MTDTEREALAVTDEMVEWALKAYWQDFDRPAHGYDVGTRKRMRAALEAALLSPEARDADRADWRGMCRRCAETVKKGYASRHLSHDAGCQLIAARDTR